MLLFQLITLKAEAVAQWKNVPTKFECGRIYAELKTRKRTQYFFTDSGGGLKPFTYSESINDWEIESPKYNEFAEDNSKFVLAQLNWPSKIGWDFFPTKLEKIELRVADCSKYSDNEFCYLKTFMKDGFVGANWYADKVWQLDYLKKQVFITDKLTKRPTSNPMTLGFKTASGKRITHQARMTIKIDGKIHNMLFDTGATASYSTIAREEIKSIDSQFCAISFLRSSILNDLKKTHPEWKLIKKGDQFSGGSDLLEIPIVEIGDLKIGPIWFASRQDEIYNKYSTQMMDKNIDGAVGGNVFNHYKVTIDYPDSLIYFETQI